MTPRGTTDLGMLWRSPAIILTIPAAPQSSPTILRHCDDLRGPAHAAAGTLAAMGRWCDSCVGPLPCISVSVAAGPGSIVLLRLGYLPFDIDVLVRHFAPLLVPSLVLCGDMTFVP
uniref:Uncharacterized protein n=1 Tax=Aegilops tauschii TaxID=37682 RepID=M8BCC2_AEGTA